jgi:hypothetical protein
MQLSSAIQLAAEIRTALDRKYAGLDFSLALRKIK